MGLLPAAFLRCDTGHGSMWQVKAGPEALQTWKSGKTTSDNTFSSGYVHDTHPVKIPRKAIINTDDDVCKRWTAGSGETSE